MTELAELLNRRVRLWLDGTRGNGRTLEGVVVAHPGYGFVIPAPDGRVPFTVDETRVLDLWGGSGRMIGSWAPIFNGRKRGPKPPPQKSERRCCGNCRKPGHNRLHCKEPLRV